MKGLLKLYRININSTQIFLERKTRIPFLTHSMRLELYYYQNQRQFKKKSIDQYFLWMWGKCALLK